MRTGVERKMRFRVKRVLGGGKEVLGGSQEKAVERELENSCRAESGKEEKTRRGE